MELEKWESDGTREIRGPGRHRVTVWLCMVREGEREDSMTDNALPPL
jgi:hypothetical protein